jgi:hypothetical protein
MRLMGDYLSLVRRAILGNPDLPQAPDEIVQALRRIARARIIDAWRRRRDQGRDRTRRALAQARKERALARNLAAELGP